MKHIFAAMFCLLALALVASAQPFPSVGSLSRSGATNTAVLRGGSYSSISNAVAAAVPGDTVVVNPGTYYEHNLLKRGVNLHFLPGSKLVWFSPGSTLAGALGFFDDRGTGATTNIVTGSLDFYFSCGTNFDGTDTGNINSAGAVVLTNALTQLSLEMHDADGDCQQDLLNQASINGSGISPSLFFISNTRRAEIKCNHIKNSLRYWTTAGGNPSVLNGCYWQAGETFFEFQHMDPFINYGIWPNDVTTNNHADNFWIRGGQCEGYIYASINSTNVRCWYNFDELKVTNSLAFAAFTAFGGKHYLVADKISVSDANSSCIFGSANLNGGCEIWLTAQKLTAPSGGSWVKANVGTLHLSAQHYEALSTLSANGGFYFPVDNLVNAEILGGEAYCDGLGVNWAPANGYNNASTLLVKDLGLNTSRANIAGNKSIFVGTNGVSVAGCRFKVPAAATASIAGPLTGAPQTVGVYWSAANVTTNGSITFTPNGGWTVNTSVH